MSRIGNKPINIPSGVKISIDSNVVTVEGSKGKLNHTLPSGITASISDGVMTLKRLDDSKQQSALHGLTRTLIDNMVIGVTTGFSKVLELVGVGYRVALKGKQLDFNVLKSHPTLFTAPEGIEFSVEGNNKITVKGIDKQLVGQVAADIRKIRKPEPYKGKGIRYQGEHIILKDSKSGKK